VFNQAVETRRWPGPALAALSVPVLAAGLVLLGGDRAGATPDDVIGGPYARMLNQATDLGPARTETVQLTAALRGVAEPVELQGWAGANDLSVRWRDGNDWAVIEGTPTAVADAFGVAVHD